MVSADIAESAVLEQIAETMEKEGPVDVLVNCAGITCTAAMTDTPIQSYKVSGSCDI